MTSRENVWTLFKTSCIQLFVKTSFCSKFIPPLGIRAFHNMSTLPSEDQPQFMCTIIGAGPGGMAVCFCVILMQAPCNERSK